MSQQRNPTFSEVDVSYHRSIDQANTSHDMLVSELTNKINGLTEQIQAHVVTIQSLTKENDEFKKKNSNSPDSQEEIND